MIEKGRVRGFLREESWRTFHWKKLVMGRKLYRIQYAILRRARVEADEKTNDPASDSEAAR